jgi:hypothetical protein
MSANRFLMRVFVHGKEKMEQENGENYVTRRYIICSRPNCVPMILLERMRWAGYTRLEQMRNVYSISVTKAEMKKAVVDVGVDGTRIFESKLNKQGVGV